MNVLVVDDELSMRSMYQQVIGRRDHRVAVFATAEEALVACSKGLPDFMVVDLGLPQMSGIEFCQHVRALPGGEIPWILIATGLSSEGKTLAAALDAGASDYLTKSGYDQLATRLTIAERGAANNRKRHLIEEEILGSKKDLVEIIDRLPIGIAIPDNDKLAYCNRIWADFFKKTPADLIGTPLAASLHPDDQQRFAMQMRNSRALCDVPTQEYRLSSDGRPRLVEITLAEIFERGAAPRTLIAARDVTEYKQMQASLIVSDRMASVGTLAAGVAHEINNPLAFVIANLGYMFEQLQTLSAPSAMLDDFKEVLGETRAGADRVRLIVRDLKTFSRVDDTVKKSVDVQKVMESSINMAWNEIRHRARLVKDYGDIPAVEGNESRLGQVFLNLLVNAAQAIEEGDVAHNEIRISLRTAADGNVNIEIRDTGAGISAEAKERIFDPFFTTKPAGVGTGLGLSICRNLIEAMGAKIDFESSLGVGTTFKITMAASRGVALEESAQPMAKDKGRSARVLIIDDELFLTNAIRRELRGHQISVANGGVEALRTLEANPAYDVIFCDLMMPDLSGMELFEQVKARWPELCDRFVFMSGSGFTPRARSFLQNISNHRFEKPFDMKAAHALIAERLKQLGA